ncbi:MAG: response regulator, partial [Acidobacteriota bacterium]|nr:response regulator [Acidobacteriota bacterium]
SSVTLKREDDRTTILIIEDDEGVRKVVSRIIVKAGFHVLPASSAAEALSIQNDYAGVIQLLLSDIMMPDMSGPEVATKMKILRPDMKVMLMSGYPDGALLLLNYGWHFIQKPFLPANLISSIQDVLSSEIADQGCYRFETRK